jgi:hypothetical protein
VKCFWDAKLNKTLFITSAFEDLNIIVSPVCLGGWARLGRLHLCSVGHGENGFSFCIMTEVRDLAYRMKTLATTSCVYWKFSKRVDFRISTTYTKTE